MNILYRRELLFLGCAACYLIGALIFTGGRKPETFHDSGLAYICGYAEGQYKALILLKINDVKPPSSFCLEYNQILIERGVQLP